MMNDIPNSTKTKISEAKQLTEIVGISRRTILVMLACWVAIICIGFTGVLYLTNQKQASEEQMRREQVQNTATAVRSKVEQWVEAQQSVVNGLAENTSLKLYATEILNPNASTDAEVVESLNDFLRNLLVAEAQSNNFLTPQPESIGANLGVIEGSGIALLDNSGEIISATAGFPALKSLPQEVQTKLFQHSSAFPIGPFTFNGEPYAIFKSAVRAVQAEDTATPIGHIVGLRKLDKSLMSLLMASPESLPTTQSMLITSTAGNLSYISPTQTGADLQTINTSDSLESSAEKLSITRPSEISFNLDYTGKSVLATAQSVRSTDWFLLHKVNESIAMANSNAYKAWMVTAYMLLVSCLTAVGFAVLRQMEVIGLKHALLSARNVAKLDNLSVSQQAQETPKEAQQKYDHAFAALIQALVNAVDSRDPNAQHHSEYVSYIAHDIAMEMKLSPDEVKATTLAARLMNVGKIKAPEKSLTNAVISTSDKNKVRQAMYASVDILKDVPFDVPVVETLQQVREHMDGSGPLGLKENMILPSAKIIAVVNAFVAMISPRSYRMAFTSAAALESIRSSLDTVYSREVFVVLEQYLKDENGTEMLSKLRERTTV
jgi:HD-GYP domain-containing protein (c-di-GMP phosphodiesterase class II)